MFSVSQSSARNASVRCASLSRFFSTQPRYFWLLSSSPFSSLVILSTSCWAAVFARATSSISSNMCDSDPRSSRSLAFFSSIAAAKVVALSSASLFDSSSWLNLPFNSSILACFLARSLSTSSTSSEAVSISCSYCSNILSFWRRFVSKALCVFFVSSAFLSRVACCLFRFLSRTSSGPLLSLAAVNCSSYSAFNRSFSCLSSSASSNSLDAFFTLYIFSCFCRVSRRSMRSISACKLSSSCRVVVRLNCLESLSRRNLSLLSWISERIICSSDNFRSSDSFSIESKVFFKISFGVKRLKLPTLSCGMNEHRLSTSIDNEVMSDFTSACFTILPLIVHLLPLLSEFMVRRTVIIASSPNISTSTKDSLPSAPCLTNLLRSLARPTSPVEPPQAKQIAWVMALLPVPLGPMTTFNLGPGFTSHSSYVKKFFILIREIEPIWKP
mmetsp:Transcript_28203/g.47446  ORF Transcript_28203/g.47446 Transcript_28203/m.47446 type:complete len:442 (-) Transcript_28203:88-1413(-)